MRIGAKKRPFYRVVVVDERTKRTGAYIELLGNYNPLTEPKDIKLKQDRIDYWIKQGAKPSHGYLRMIGKAPQRPPRKPKKEKKKAAETKQEKLETLEKPTSQAKEIKLDKQTQPSEQTEPKGPESEKKDEGSA